MAEQESAAGSRGIQVIARAAEILRAIESSPSGLTQAEIANAIGLPRTTVHRILSALEDESFVVVHSRRGRYQLGPALTRMAAVSRRDIVARLHPYLVELSLELNETVDLSVLEGTRVTFLDQVVAPQALRAVSAVGESFPLHCTAPGKAILAGLSDDEVEGLVGSRLPALTDHTITSLEELRGELAGTTAADGLAFDREEHHDGICAVGCAVSDAAVGTLAISVPVPAQRFAGREHELGKALLACRDRLVDELDA